MLGFLVKLLSVTLKLVFDCLARIYSFALWVIGAMVFLGICIIPILLFIYISKNESLVLLSIVSIGWVIFAAKLLQIVVRSIDSKSVDVYGTSVHSTGVSHVVDDLLQSSNGPIYESKGQRNAVVPNTNEHIKKYGSTDVYGSVE